MQEKFALRKTLKKVAALGTSLALVGVTVSGALAAGLGDLPTPFNNNPAQTVVVYGNAGNDMDSTNDVVVGFGGTPRGSTSSYTVGGSSLAELALDDFEIGDRHDIAAGLNLSSQFGTTVDETDSAGLVDGSISIDIGRDTDYDYHEVCDIGFGNGNEPVISSSLDDGDEDYGDEPVLLLPEDSFQCRIEFEEALHANNTLTDATDTNTIEIPFLGQTLVVTGATRTSLTAYTGEKVRLRIGDTLQIEGKTLTLNGVDNNGVLLDVDGVAESINEQRRKRVNGIEIYVSDSFNSDVDSNDQAILVASLGEAIETYDNGNEYPGQDENNFLWEWNLSGLNETSTSLIDLGVRNHEDLASPEVGDFEDEIMNLGLLKSNKAYLTQGDYLCLPNRYVCMVFEGQKGDIQYRDYTISANDRESLDTTGAGTTNISSARTIKFSSNVGNDRGFITVAGLTAARADLEKTDTLWLYWHTQNNVGGALGPIANDTLMNIATAYYAVRDTGMARIIDLNNNGSAAINDDHLPARMTGVVVNQSIPIARFDNGDYNSYIYVNVSKDMGLAGITVGPTDNITYITLSPISSLTAGTVSNITFRANGGSSDGYSFLGDKDGQDTTPFLCYGNGDNDCNDTNDLDFSGWDTDVLRNDGVIVKDPDGNLDNDKVALKVPNDDEFKFWVRLAKPKSASVTTSSSGTAAAALSMKDTEVGAVSGLGKNVVAVGGPAVNSVTAELLGVTFPTYGADVPGLSSGTGVLELKDLAGGKKALLVYGWGADDTRRAALVVKNAPTFRTQLGASNSAVVSGTSLEVGGITVTAA